MFRDLSLITCSYNTPLLLEVCLKSFVFHHEVGPHNIVIIENSTSCETQHLLDANHITYVKNTGGTHSSSVDLALGCIKTRYALLVDTDVIFKQSIASTFYFFKRYGLTLLGELQGDRGGYLLYPRIAPYFCFIDIENIRACEIKFHNEEQVERTNSGDFFKNIPIKENQEGQRFYDVGSTFYEQANTHHLGVANLEDIQNIVFHAESLSWSLQCGRETYKQMGREREDSFFSMARQYEQVTIKDCFRGI